MPLLSAIYTQPELWNQNTLRTTHPGTVHRDVSDIWLWFHQICDESLIDDIQTTPYSAWYSLPQARCIIFDLMRRVEATQLGRCIITKLPPGKSIDPHVDQGAPAEFYKRFQLILQSFPGCNFHIEDEQVSMKPGDVWLIDNNKEHWVVNNSQDDRIALIIDLRCS